MRKIFICAVLLFILNFQSSILDSAEDRRELQSQTLSIQNQQRIQESPPSRPILPPVIPPSPSIVSPTPSPHLSVPPVTQAPLGIPPTPQISQPQIGSIPGTPAYSNISTMNIPTELPQVPIIGNSLGKVLKMGIDEDNIPWIEVNDELFDETLKIKVDPKSTSVIKKTAVMNFRDIKIGDTVDVIFNQEDDRITANVISILTEEDLRAMEESLKSESTITTEDKSSSPPKE